MKKIVFFVVLVASVFAINNLVRSIYSLWNKQDLLSLAQKDVEKEKAENIELLQKLKIVESEEFIEKEARNKLFMVKPGEHLVVLPSIEPKKEQKTNVDLPNWQKWLNLFF